MSGQMAVLGYGWLGRGGRFGSCQNVRGHQALGALRQLEIDPLAFLEAFEALHLDGREMGEGICAAAVMNGEGRSRPRDHTDP